MARPAASSARAQPTVPGSEDQSRLTEGKGAGEVNGVGAAQRVPAGEPTSVLLDGAGELDWPGRRPELIPGPLGGDSA